MSVKKDIHIHTSVLLQELVDWITIYPDRKNVIVDATLWLAGHAIEILKKMNPWDIFVWFDADERNLHVAKQKLKQIQTETQGELSWRDKEESPGRKTLEEIQIVLIHSNFLHLEEKLAEHDIPTITGIYYDLWVSSVHFDEADRWFSFRMNGPLDMRFDTHTWKTAADILNFYEEADIYKILKEYGEEPYARKIAARTITQRKKKKFVSTDDLTQFLDTEINSHIKTKMRVFQALRIAVNKELENLETSLQQAIKLLETWGNIFAISFHSLEDRIVKQTFKKETRDCICSDIICSCRHEKTLKILTKKPIIPTKTEQQENPRSRSAKARSAVKI